jgi:DNA-binding CsgD family transcriptional regulator/PAS domain-containing protein
VPSATGSISAALALVPLPMAVVDLGDSRVVAANEACERLVVEPGRTVVGRWVHEFTAPERLEIAKENFRSLMTRVEGYQVHGRVVPENGREFSALFWVRRLHLDDTSALAAIVVLPDDPGPRPVNQTIVASTDVDAGFLETDQDWNIDYCSNDICDLLGYEPDNFIGNALLGMVHPVDAPDFLLAVTQAVTSRRAIVARVRLKTRDLSWRDTECLVAAMSKDEPPRLAVVVTVARSDSERGASSRAAELEQHMWRIALEVRAAGLTPALSDTFPLGPTKEFGEMTTRQREIVARLAAGKKVKEIARDMYLSPSTVRNHLTAVFRRFGVHSQLELISVLKNLWDPRS